MEIILFHREKMDNIYIVCLASRLGVLRVLATRSCEERAGARVEGAEYYRSVTCNEWTDRDPVKRP